MADVRYWSTIVLLVLTVLVFCYNLLSFRSLLPAISWRNWLMLLLIVLLGAHLRFFWIPKQHNVFYDELIHMDIGQRAYADQKIGTCRYTSLQKPRLHTPKWGTGFYAMQAIWYHIMPPGMNSAFVFNRVLSVLTIIGSFFLAATLFSSSSTGLWSALLISVYPLHLKFSCGISIEIASILFQQISLLLMIFYILKDKPVLFYGSLLASVYYCLVRLDNSIIGIPVIIFITYVAIKRANSLKTKFRTAIICMITVMPVIGYGMYALKKEAAYHSLDLPIYFWDNLTFWMMNNIHPWFYTVMAVAGLFICYRKDRNIFIGIALGICLPLIFYSVIHRVSFFRADFCRFALLFSLFLILPAAKGFETLQRKKGILLYGLVIAVFLSAGYSREKIVQSYKLYLEQEIQFIKAVNSRLPRNTLFLSEMPFLHRTVQQAKSFHVAILQDPEKLTQLRKMQRPIFLYRPIITLINREVNEKLYKTLEYQWIIKPFAEKEIIISGESLQKLNTIRNEPKHGVNHRVLHDMKVKIGFYELVPK